MNNTRLYSPHPFCWRPAGGERHATTERPGEGQTFTALCGLVAEADLSEIGWFFATCGACNARAHELAAVPMPSAPDASGAREC
ncbi:zinc finger protein [Saccharopolyspora sp. TS4A08]|uniref:Zinc finger protein n=1 Tax=Saccharopolyspora ipomoeae TaxID=3042027 RepID=A0ABT6PXT8_9PSEU|nr:zinc finger protein [Saccharopolyspora sp. TS4A08]MDI2032822.1 zinc finger protein [Saccharopolyspora sp. TS4A08]